MLNTAGLSLEQAPPISVPFAFFLGAPLFAAVAGGLMMLEGDVVVASRWTPPALAMTHLLTLGFLAQIMCGALFQMLPVLAGSPVPHAVLTGRVTQGALVVGTLALSFGLYRGGAFWILAGAGLSSASLVLFGVFVGIALSRARGVVHTVRAMRAALLALLMTLLLGVMLAAVLAKGVTISGFGDWVDMHLAWGLLGWAGMLIMGVGFQVVPMFHVTPAFPRWMMRFGAPLLFAGLMAALTLELAHRTEWLPQAFGMSVLAFVAFAAMVVDRQRRRARPRIDTTLLYWWLAMGAAMAAAASWLFGVRGELTGVLLLVGVGIGLPSGMLFKIMPFMSWFHLQSRQIHTRRFAVRVPHMHVFVPEAQARVQFFIYASALVLLLVAAAWPQLGLAPLAGLALLVSALFLEGLLVICAVRYRRCRRLLD